MYPIYLDNNATTPLLPEVWEAMRPFAVDSFGNPASAHWFARRARQALEESREKVAGLLDAHPDEVIFTSGATEANNLALFGLCGEPPATLIASPIEHPSVMEPLRQLEARGFAIRYLPVSTDGQVTLPESMDSTSIVAVQLVNHEMGAIQRIKEMTTALASWAPMADTPRRADALRSPPVRFHCDATQAVGRMPVAFHDLGVTTLAFSGHKFHGPKGIGCLLLRRGVKLKPRIWGGHQQQGRRPGTEPVFLAVGLAKALELACTHMEERLGMVGRLRESFLVALKNENLHAVLNGPAADGMPHTLNLSFPGLKGDALLIALDQAAVACSTGSACSSGSLQPSPVLQALAVVPERLQSALRFSLSHLLSEADIEQAVRRLAEVVRRQQSTVADEHSRGKFSSR